MYIEDACWRVLEGAERGPADAHDARRLALKIAAVLGEVGQVMYIEDACWRVLKGAERGPADAHDAGRLAPLNRSSAGRSWVDDVHSKEKLLVQIG